MRCTFRRVALCACANDECIARREKSEGQEATRTCGACACAIFTMVCRSNLENNNARITRNTRCVLNSSNSSGSNCVWQTFTAHEEDKLLRVSCGIMIRTCCGGATTTTTMPSCVQYNRRQNAHTHKHTLYCDASSCHCNGQDDSHMRKTLSSGERVL